MRGRVIQYAATADDEIALLDFLRTTANIQLFDYFAPSIDDLWVDQLSQDVKANRHYWIWNKDFAWEPRYKRVFPEVQDKGGWFFVANTSSAPVLEFFRCNWTAKGLSMLDFGSISWSKATAVLDEPQYDVSAFSRWFERIARWVKKLGKKTHPWPNEPYYLPGAWKFAIEADESQGLLPAFDDCGNLPPGVHQCTSEEFATRFGGGSEERIAQLSELLQFVEAAKTTGIRRLMVSGSFVTAKLVPNDVDIVILPAAGYPRQGPRLESDDFVWTFLQIIVAADDADFESWATEQFSTDRGTYPKGVVEVIL